MLSVRNNVRNIIGSSHWGEEGRYKEIVFRNVLRRFLPKDRIIGTGFAVYQSDSNESWECSKQIDVLIFPTECPVLFSEGDFYIIDAEYIEAVIEIKTRTDSAKFQNALGHVTDIARLVMKSHRNRSILKPNNKDCFLVFFRMKTK
jgi:hypothetical protein